MDPVNDNGSRTTTMIEPGRCGGCRWFARFGVDGLGWCYYAPPAPLRDPLDGEVEWTRPTVGDRDGCAQFSAAYLPQSGYEYERLGGPTEIMLAAAGENQAAAGDCQDDDDLPF